MFSCLLPTFDSFLLFFFFFEVVIAILVHFSREATSEKGRNDGEASSSFTERKQINFFYVCYILQGLTRL